jgi:uncharacterized protein YaaQ
MIRVPHRANDVVGRVCSLPRQLVGRVSSCGVAHPVHVGVTVCPHDHTGPAGPSPRPGAPPILRRVKLVVAIVHTEDAGHLVDGLLEREFRATRLHSSGGFLKQSNATVILGVEDDQVEAALAVIRDNCHSRTQLVNPMPPIMEPGEFFLPYPLEVEVGGATVFVLPVERVERI